MQAGDHLVSQRLGYIHHGLYVGNDTVIHYAGLNNIFDLDTSVQEVDLEEFEQGMGFEVLPLRQRRYSAQESIERAESRLGENLYNIAINNCEHFVNWCIQGQHRSKQVEALLMGGIAGLQIHNHSTATNKRISRFPATPPSLGGILLNKLFDND